jgi:hypothetical protein
MAGLGAPHVPSAMRPYLSVAYWGIDRVASVEEISVTHILDSKDPLVITAKEDLEYNLRLGRHGEPVPLSLTLAAGESFDPDEHDAGTIIIFSQETLSRLEPHVQAVDLRKFTRRTALPKPPTSLRLPVETGEPFPAVPKQLIGGGLVYQALVNCGVVVQPRRRSPKQIMTFDGTGVVKPDAVEGFKSELGKVRLSRTLSRPRLESGPLPIGQSRAQNNKKGTKPRWVRVNALGIVA